MNKNYYEPEFTVVKTNTEDVITASGEGSGTLDTVSVGWEQNGGVPFLTL